MPEGADRRARPMSIAAKPDSLILSLAQPSVLVLPRSFTMVHPGKLLCCFVQKPAASYEGLSFCCRVDGKMLRRSPQWRIETVYK